MNVKSNNLVESFSGIRGVFGADLDADLAYEYAFTYCQLFCSGKSTLVIGGDSRVSTKIIKKAMIKAFADFGVKKVIDVGLVPVQTCQLAILKFKASGGVYITASHNEGNYNGWKFLKNDGAILYPDQAYRLISEVKSFKESYTKKSGKMMVLNKNKEAIEDYVCFVLNRIGKKSLLKIKKANFKILADPNGGSSIAIVSKLFRRMGVRAVIINNKPGKFVRLVEPNLKSLAYLSEKIDNKGFQFACGFDCDSDRVEYVLPNVSGNERMISGNYVLALASDAILEGTKGQVVVVNDCTSYLVRDVIKEYNAKLKEVEVGEINVVSEMEKRRSIIGGEGSSSGVIVPPIKCRDGIMATALILKLIAERGQKLEDILKGYPKYYAKREERQCLPQEAIRIKGEVEKYFLNKNYRVKKTGGDSGGLKILFDDSSYVWFRLSKTEPGKFRIIADGNDINKVENMLKEGCEVFDKFSKS